MSDLGPISNPTAGSPGNKDLVEAWQPLLLATITFNDSAPTILRLSTHPLNAAEGGFAPPTPGSGGPPWGGNSYLARLLDQNIDAVQAMSDTGIDMAPAEYASIAREAWTEALRPALADRQGRALFIGTPLGRNHF